MAELKTKQTDQSVDEFLGQVPDPGRRQDCYTVLDLMKKATGAPPKMWGDAIVGFGQYRYKYASGREGDWFLTGFSPRKGNLTLYIIAGFAEYGDLLSRLGKYKSAKSCLYIKKLEDIDLSVLQELVTRSVKRLSNLG
jgi:hypothetical protein